MMFMIYHTNTNDVTGVRNKIRAHKLKQRIIEIMETCPNNGSYVAEFASVSEFEEEEIANLLYNDDDFFWDDENEVYIGWRLSKYK